MYRLIDPRNGETFYVGKGKANRVFEHAKELVEEDELSEKLSRIRAIRLAGLEVSHVIHRHDMDEEVALEVEAALIDAYPGVSNVVDGHGSSDLGTMHAAEINRKYRAETAVFDGKDKIVLISINRSSLERSIYEATRFSWRLNKNRAELADLIFATVQGVIAGVFVNHSWLEATPANFPGREEVLGRYGFKGEEATEAIKSRYIGKRVPSKYTKRGASNPIKYTW